MNGIVLATRTPVVRKENGRCQVPPACRYIRAPKELCRERIFIEGMVLAIFEKELRRLLRMGYIHDSNITSIGKSRHLIGQNIFATREPRSAVPLFEERLWTR